MADLEAVEAFEQNEPCMLAQLSHDLAECGVCMYLKCGHCMVSGVRASRCCLSASIACDECLHGM